MRRIATLLTLTASLLLAASAFAFDVKAPVSGPSPDFILTVASCDNGNINNAFFQADIGRYGNNFNFGGGSVLSAVEIVHFGWQTLAGPYLFDIELWDDNTCTYISSVDNLLAADAYFSPITEVFNVCPAQLVANGSVNVLIDSNSCFDPTDCYPDIMFDDQIGTCQRAFDSTAPVCAADPGAGNFLLRVDLNNCPTPAHKPSWGELKVRYN